MKTKGNSYYAHVLKVIDGDTFECLVDLGFNVVQKFKVRLDGIDTPEKDTKKGISAKAFVENLIQDKDIVLKDAGTEKYGRALASVELMDGKDLTTLLIEQGIGREYHGEKKPLIFSLSICS
jgi:micrococcal nuclease